jgi:beta-N-acetylhexosaminidase
VAPFDAEKDLDAMVDVWTAALPTYALPSDSLRSLIAQPNAHHHIARVGAELAGFCLAYINYHGDPNTAYIAAVAVHPKYQHRGIGTVLLAETRASFRAQFGFNRLKLSSSFPRFWPGVPQDLPESVQEFFIHRGFRLSPPGARSVDLYQDIRNFQAPEKYMARAQEGGFYFAPLQEEDYEACLVEQRRNFSDKPVRTPIIF